MSARRDPLTEAAALLSDNISSGQNHQRPQRTRKPIDQRPPILKPYDMQAFFGQWRADIIESPDPDRTWFDCAADFRRRVNTMEIGRAAAADELDKIIRDQSLFAGASEDDNQARIAGALANPGPSQANGHGAEPPTPSPEDYGTAAARLPATIDDTTAIVPAKFITPAAWPDEAPPPVDWLVAPDRRQQRVRLLLIADEMQQWRALSHAAAALNRRWEAHGKPRTCNRGQRRCRQTPQHRGLHAVAAAVTQRESYSALLRSGRHIRTAIAKRSPAATLRVWRGIRPSPDLYAHGRDNPLTRCFPISRARTSCTRAAASDAALREAPRRMVVFAEPASGEWQGKTGEFRRTRFLHTLRTKFFALKTSRHTTLIAPC